MNVLADFGAVAFGTIVAPALRFIARRRGSMPRFQKLADKAGFQLRSNHYYEPTYSETDLPADTQVERSIPGLDLNEAGQLELLAKCKFAADLQSIPLEKPDKRSFGYHNNMYSFGDAEMLYNMVRIHKPKRIIEVGSGQSTLMAREAIKAVRKIQPDYQCHQTCIEPYEEEWLESVATVIRKRVEKVDLAIFDQLEAGDFLFIDSSHVIRPFGDVLREIHEIIPRMKPGVVIHVHDIFTPRDYPEAWLRHLRRLWNEQYLLEAFLAFNSSYEVICATNWLKHTHSEALFAACPMLGRHPESEPGAFWFRRKSESGR
jgi:predicted O-methyltransferase YrrM